MAKRNVVVVDRLEDGAMAILLDLRSEAGRVVASLDKDAFMVNRNNILEMKRPDRNTLIVVDQSKRQAIKARYLNRQAFSIEGAVFVPGRGIISLGNPLNMAQFDGNCMSQSFGPMVGIEGIAATSVPDRMD